jgi:hypothetical protein
VNVYNKGRQGEGIVDMAVVYLASRPFLDVVSAVMTVEKFSTYFSMGDAGHRGEEYH